MSINILKEKLSQLERELEQSHIEVKKYLMENEHQPTNDHVYCYFNHSIILNHIEPSSHLIMGNFYMKNISSKAMQSPVILLKINANTEFNFTGKYKAVNQNNQAYNFHWERIMMEDLDPMTHYCFKPTQTDQLLPNEQLGFQSFQIVIPNDTSLMVEGFTYFNQSNDGIPAINSIDISI